MLHADAAFTMPPSPESRIAAGDIYDDLDEVITLVRREDGEVFLWHDLTHVIGLLGLLAYLSTSPDHGGEDRPRR